MRDVTTCILAATADCESVLELGCGLGDKLAACQCQRRVGVDVYPPYVQAAKGRWGGRIEVVQGNAVVFASRQRRFSFDAVLLIDFLEHLTRANGLTVLKHCRRIARRRTVIFCPEGPCPQDKDAYSLGGERWQTHRSEWTVADLEAEGFDAALWRDRHGDGKHAIFATRDTE